MPSDTRTDATPGLSRRGFLKAAALAGLAASALAVLSRGRAAGIGLPGRSTPADLPGAGSIFQPRNDTRAQ